MLDFASHLDIVNIYKPEISLSRENTSGSTLHFGRYFSYISADESAMTNVIRSDQEYSGRAYNINKNVSMSLVKWIDEKTALIGGTNLSNPLYSSQCACTY